MDTRETLEAENKSLKIFQWVSVNLGVAGLLFFLLFTGYIPSPLLGKLDAHTAQQDELIHVVKDLHRTTQVLCVLTATANKYDAGLCYAPPQSTTR